MSPLRRAARSALRFGLLALPLLGLAELGAHLHFARRAPDFAEWEALRAPLAAKKQPGELIVTAPRFIDPLVRAGLGDELMPLRDVARPDPSRYATALEISLFGERAEELRDWREREREAHGQVTVRRLENPSPAKITFDFTDHVDPAHAHVRGTEPPMDCPWNPKARVASGGLGGHPTFPARRFECPTGLFFNVGVTVIADQDFQPRRCIWSHPLAKGELVTTFRDVPLGRVLRGHHGMYWIIERPLTGAPVKLTVRVDGDVVGEAEHVDGAGWAAFELPLGAHAGTTAQTVEFAVTTRNYKDRHYCFEADSRW